MALEKGYYREAGIDVQLEMSGTSSDMAVLLATSRLQVIGGALSAGFFNSLSKGLPIGLLMARATSPYFHYLMIRPELKAKLREPSDLKGRTIAVAIWPNGMYFRSTSPSERPLASRILASS